MTLKDLFLVPSEKVSDSAFFTVPTKGKFAIIPIVTCGKNHYGERNS
jgi:hypothetical protein